MSVRDLLPRDKFDDRHLDDIRALRDEEFSLLAGELLEWIADINWPVAPKIVPILLDRQALVFPHLQKALQSEDIMWKCWIMRLLVPKLKTAYQLELKGEIERLFRLRGTDEDTLCLAGEARACLEACFPKE